MDLFRVTEHFLLEIQQETWTFQYWILESVGEWNGKERAGGKHSFISMILQLIPLYIHPHDPAVDSTLHSSAWSCSWFHFTFIGMILQLVPLYIHPHDPAVDSTLHSSAWSCSWFHFTIHSSTWSCSWFHFTISSLVLLPSSGVLCPILFACRPILLTFSPPENSLIFFIKRYASFVWLMFSS